jgi:basic membrane lipoprotein Med (substrate-binding protein (PBP1-ABC) superfamily)
MAISLFESGADIIAAFAGGSGLGVFTAAAEEGFLAIGCDTNQCLIDRTSSCSPVSAGLMWLSTTASGRR